MRSRASRHPVGLLPRAFYERDALDVARELIGALIRREDVVLRITETEAYRWPDDTASHNRFGRTARNAAMWGPGGHAYVYLCYGLHQMLNFVTNAEDEASAVLIRACEVVEGLDTIRARRRNLEGPALLAGPGRVAAALAVDTAWSGHPLFERGGLEVHAGPRPTKLLVGPRVGVEYARPDHRDAPWRFAAAETRWISHPKTLEPLPSPRSAPGRR